LLSLSPSSAGKDDFSARVDRIPKRPTAAQATSTITSFYAHKPTKGDKKAKGKAVEREPSEIVLSSDDDDDQSRQPSMTPGPDGASLSP